MIAGRFAFQRFRKIHSHPTLKEVLSKIAVNFDLMSIKFLGETPKRETSLGEKCLLVVMESRIFYGILCTSGLRFHVKYITLFQMPF